MGSNPYNLALRFLLEVAALVAIGFWSWKNAEPDLRFLQGIGLPVIFAIFWGVFAVKGDPSRSGRAPVPIKGLWRLLFEVVFFAFAVWCLIDIQHIELSIIMGTLVTLHYVLSFDRVTWLMKH